jgi:ATP-dependent DNA helicase RecQ
MLEYCERRSLSTNQYKWQEFIKSLPAENESVEKVAQLRLNSSALRVFPHFDSGMSSAAAAAASGFTETTITNYLSKYLEVRNITDCSTWIPHETIAIVEAAIAKVGAERLKPIFEYLEAKYSYDHIRVVATTYNVRQRSGALLVGAQQSANATFVTQ